VYDAGYDGKRFFIVMRYVEGPDLARIIRAEGPMPEPRAMRLLGQVASALYAVHRGGLVHRDVKPHNVLVWGLVIGTSTQCSPTLGSPRRWMTLAP